MNQYNLSEACYAATGIQAAMGYSSRDQMACQVAGEPNSEEPGPLSARCIILRDGGLRAVSTAGQVVMIAGCCAPDSNEKNNDLHQEAQRLTDLAYSIGPEDLTRSRDARAEITNCGSGLHYGWIVYRGLDINEFMEASAKLDEALRCPHWNPPKERRYEEDGDEDITVFGT